MTANVTPRLGLMSPVDTDPFSTEDFADTFGILDDTPGTTLVNNYNSMPTDWTTAKHGSLVMQQDNGAIWRWVKPDSGAGTFKRVNNLGLLYSGPLVPNATTTSTSPVTLGTATVTAPGGRPIRAFVHANQIAIAPGGDGRIGVWVGGTQLSLYSINSSSGSIGVSTDLIGEVATPTPNTSLTFAARFYSNNGGAISTLSLSLSVYEI